MCLSFSVIFQFFLLFLFISSLFICFCFYLSSFNIVIILFLYLHCPFGYLFFHCSSVSFYAVFILFVIYFLSRSLLIHHSLIHFLFLSFSFYFFFFFISSLSFFFSFPSCGNSKKLLRNMTFSSSGKVKIKLGSYIFCRGELTNIGNIKKERNAETEIMWLMHKVE